MGKLKASFIIDTSEIEVIIQDIKFLTINKDIRDWFFNYTQVIDDFWNFIEIKVLSSKDKLIVKVIPKEELKKAHDELRRRYAEMDT